MVCAWSPIHIKKSFAAIECGIALNTEDRKKTTSIITNGFGLLNVSAYMQQIIKGAIIHFAVLMDKRIQA